MMMTIATNNTTATQPCDPACRISRLVQLLIDAPEEVGWAVLCKSGYETLSQPRISAEQQNIWSRWNLEACSYVVEAKPKYDDRRENIHAGACSYNSLVWPYPYLEKL